MPKAYENKRFFHWESAISGNTFDSLKYIDAICAAGWRPYDVREGMAEKVIAGTGMNEQKIPIFYVSVLATREITVKQLAPEPMSQE